MKFTKKPLVISCFCLMTFLLINCSLKITSLDNSDIQNEKINSFENYNKNQIKFTESNKVENFIEKPKCESCTCDNQNNKRSIPLNSVPYPLKKSTIQSITDFPITAALSWSNNIEDLDIHLKDDKGVDFPRDWRHKTEFKKSVRRFEANGSNSIKLEVLQIKSILPKGRYLLYVYNCSNDKPMIFSKANLKIFIDTFQLEGNGKGRRRFRKIILDLKIANNAFNINDRVWRIGFIISDGEGKMLFKKIDKVSKNRAVFFDGLLEKDEVNRFVVKNPVHSIDKTAFKYQKKYGEKFCRNECIGNHLGMKKICFSRGVKECMSCKYKSFFVKTDENREKNYLCKHACNLVRGETTCKYYPYIDTNLKLFNKHLISKHMIMESKSHVSRLLN